MASRRPNNHAGAISAPFVLVLAALSLAGCGAFGYGPLQDHSAYVSAMAAPDGKRGVFTYHRFMYRPATGMRAFPDGGIPRYVRDDCAVGVYDMESGEYRVAYTLENKRWTDGQGTPYVNQVTARKALLAAGGQLRDDLGRVAREYTLLDLDTLEPAPLPLLEELESRGLELGSLHLADDSGTIIVVALPRDTARMLRNWTMDESVAKQIWLRRPDGGYEKAADAIHYYGFTDGLVHYYSGDRHMYMVYDTKTGTSAPGGKYPPSTPDKTVELQVTGGGKHLSVGRRASDGWSYTDLSLDPEGFF